MKLYQLQAKQCFPISARKAWDFLSDPRNLNKITPPQMGFKIISREKEAMYPGQIIHYKVAPLLGIDISWVTEITHVKKGYYFVDEQRFGPYSMWHHQHFLNPIDGGVEMHDIIDYVIPFGLFGQWMHRAVIQRQLRKIFAYRAQKLPEFLGSMRQCPQELSFR